MEALCFPNLAFNTCFSQCLRFSMCWSHIWVWKGYSPRCWFQYYLGTRWARWLSLQTHSTSFTWCYPFLSVAYLVHPLELWFVAAGRKILISWWFTDHSRSSGNLFSFSGRQATLSRLSEGGNTGNSGTTCTCICQLVWCCLPNWYTRQTESAALILGNLWTSPSFEVCRRSW